MAVSALHAKITRAYINHLIKDTHHRLLPTFLPEIKGSYQGKDAEGKAQQSRKFCAL